MNKEHSAFAQFDDKTQQQSALGSLLDPDGTEINQFALRSGQSRSDIWSMVRRGQLYARTENGFVYIFSKKPKFSSDPLATRESPPEKDGGVSEQFQSLSKDFIEKTVVQDLEQKTRILSLDSEMEDLKVQIERKHLENQLLRQEIEDLETLNSALLKTSEIF